jgi:hypothetical protein
MLSFMRNYWVLLLIKKDYLCFQEFVFPHFSSHTAWCKAGICYRGCGTGIKMGYNDKETTVQVSRPTREASATKTCRKTD